MCVVLRPECSHSYVCNYYSNKPQTTVTNDLLMVFSGPRAHHAWFSSRVFSLCCHLFIQRNKCPHSMSIKNNYRTPCQMGTKWLFIISPLPRCDGNRGYSDADTHVWQDGQVTVKRRAGTPSSLSFTPVGYTRIPSGTWVKPLCRCQNHSRGSRPWPGITGHLGLTYSLATFKKHVPNPVAGIFSRPQDTTPLPPYEFPDVYLD